MRFAGQASIAVVPSEERMRHKARLLAARLGLPLVCQGVYESSLQKTCTVAMEERCAFLLVVKPERIEIRETSRREQGPIYADFVGGALGYRRQRLGGRNELLARAVGVKPGIRPAILDATAGLGRDAFILACLGCTVHMIERRPVIAALLEDALLRAKQNEKTYSVIQEFITFTHGEASAVMTAIVEERRPDVVYLDPMFPKNACSALVKKEMRLFQSFVGDDDDAPQLLTAAMDCARKRVVVKRPRLGAAIEGSKPSLTMKGKSTRYDIYFGSHSRQCRRIS